MCRSNYSILTKISILTYITGVLGVISFFILSKQQKSVLKVDGNDSTIQVLLLEFNITETTTNWMRKRAG